MMIMFANGLADSPGYQPSTLLNCGGKWLEIPGDGLRDVQQLEVLSLNVQSTDGISIEGDEVYNTVLLEGV